MAYPAYPRRVTRAHRKAMIDLVGEDSIVHGREVSLFELMTALETPDVQKEIIRGHVICQSQNSKRVFSPRAQGLSRL